MIERAPVVLRVYDRQRTAMIRRAGARGVPSPASKRGALDGGKADFGGFARHRAAELLYRPHRSQIPRPRTAAGAHRGGRRYLRHRRPRPADPHGADRRRRQGSQGPEDGRRQIRGAASRRLGSDGSPRRPGSRRRRRRAALRHRRYDAVHPSRLRLQAGLLCRLQPLAPILLRGRPRPAFRPGANGDALG